MGYSESISAHTAITTTDNSGLDMSRRRACADRGISRSSEENIITHKGLFRRRSFATSTVFQVVFVEYAHCAEQSMCRGTVCRSPGVLPCIRCASVDHPSLSCLTTVVAHLVLVWRSRCCVLLCMNARCLSQSCLTPVRRVRQICLHASCPVLPWALPCGASEVSFFSW